VLDACREFYARRRRRVIGLAGTVRVLVATKPVDFRKGAEGLAALVREQMQADPFSGAIYVFRAKRARPREADLLGWHRRVPVRQAAAGWQVQVAKCAG
jgi:transposase